MQLNSPKRITINASSAVIQVIVIGLVYFFLYRFLIVKLGADLLGLWSLIVATTSVANLANLGFSSGLVKFIADKNALNKTNELGQLIFTALISITIIYLVFSVFIFYGAPFLLNKLVETKYIDVALSLLPWSLSCLLLNAAGGVFTSALEGIQKNYLRNFIHSLTAVVFLILSFILVPRMGIVGVALAQNIQALLVLAYTFYHTGKNISSFRLRKWDWNKAAFLSMFQYGYKFQLITVMQLIVDPITKALLSKFGGLATLAYYEMAYRLTSQVRSVIINAYQVTIPVIAHYNQVQKSYLKHFYLRSFPFVFTAGMIAFSGLIFFSGIISRFWIGPYEQIFVNCSIIVAIGMFGNTLSAPAYFNYLGTGKINLLVLVQLMDALVNVALCFILSSFFPTYGVVFAWTISTMLGATLTLVVFHRENKIRLTDLIRKNNLALLLSGCLMLLVSTLLYNSDRFIVYFVDQNKYAEFILMGVFFSAIMFLSIFTKTKYINYKNKISRLLG